MTQYADQHAHNVAWMTAQERDEYDRHLESVWNNEGGRVVDSERNDTQ